MNYKYQTVAPIEVSKKLSPPFGKLAHLNHDLFHVVGKNDFGHTAHPFLDLIFLPLVICSRSCEGQVMRLVM